MFISDCITVPFGNLNEVRRGNITVAASADTHERHPAREITKCNIDMLTFQVNQAVEES
jgi:hypothetical protein